MKVTTCLGCGKGPLEEVAKRIDDNIILRCSNCQIMMVADINDDTESLYTAEYFEKDEGTKFGYADYLSSPVTTLVGKYAFARLFSPVAATHIDLGSADGSLMEIFKSKGHETYGLEISQDAVDIAVQKGLSVKQSNLNGFPKGTPVVDCITAYDLLEHADAPGRVVEEVYRHLKDNGVFVFSTLSVDVGNKNDYWLNNSLEHYIYYDEKALENLLSRVFGVENFQFKEIIIDGIAEFWGFAKKGSSQNEKKIIKSIGTTPKLTNPEEAYMLSLFYDQSSMFNESQKIIDMYQSSWSPVQILEAQFYNYFFSGQFEKAIELHKKSKRRLPLSSAIYWQGLQYIAFEMQNIIDNEHKMQTKESVMSNERLKKENQQLQDTIKHRDAELKGLKESKLTGSIIRVARAKALASEDIRLNKGAGIRRKLYRKTVMKPYEKMRASYAHQRLRYELVEQKMYTSKTPLVSIVIPYYNRHETIIDTLDSVASQTYLNYEVILVDDGSTEKASQDILKKVAGHPAKPKIVEQNNHGVASARNNGIKQSKGKYIVCLDSDDIIRPLYIEKCVTVLESDPSVSLVTTGIEAFGVSSWKHIHQPYDPRQLFSVNMATTASMFRVEAWEDAGGYKSDLGYEDWELWLSMAEKGHFGRVIPEFLFRYRTATQSRFIEDRSAHTENIKKIQSLHPDYHKKVRQLLRSRRYSKKIIEPKTAFINLSEKTHFKTANKPGALLCMPWMTFGGAETLIINFAKELKDDYDITFVTGLSSEHEWQDRFEAVSEKIYHLPNLFDSRSVYFEFISNYITSRDIRLLHMVHTNFMYDMLPELKQRHPKLKIILTMFNTRVDHFPEIKNYHQFISMLSSDNTPVVREYEKLGVLTDKTRVIPNGIDSTNTFNPEFYGVAEERQRIGVNSEEIAVFFIGRLSEEKNPDVFTDVAEYFDAKTSYSNIRFFVVGDGPMKSQIEKNIAGLSNIEYLGYRSDIPSILAAADVFILPSSIEGFPLSILEAMAMNNVCIASSVGAVPDLLKEGEDGFVITPGSKNEIVDSILLLHDDPKRLKSMQQKSRQTVVELYSSETLGKNYKKLYKDALNK